MSIVHTKDTDWYLLASELRAKAISSAIEIDISNSSIKQPMPRDWLPIIFAEDKEPLPTISTGNSRGFDSSDQSVNGWIAQVREKLYSNTSVEDIFVCIENVEVDVWVVITKRDITALRQIVEKEDELLRILASGDNPALFIDFHVIYRCGRNTEELAPTRAIRLPKEVL